MIVESGIPEPFHSFGFIIERFAEVSRGGGVLYAANG